MIYTSEKCPVCKKAFTENDDIVVCPICGTPHHRDCYTQQNSCANDALHKDNFEWHNSDVEDKDKISEDINTQSVNTKENTKVDDGHNIVFCPNCGKENPAEEPVCTNCGARLYNNSGNKLFSPQVNLPDMSNQQFSTPVIQISPDDTIGGNKVSDMAEYIQLNAEGYIPKMFKMEKTKSKTSWNWAAFIFTPYWFFFRKMHVVGFSIMLILLLITGTCTTDRLVSAAGELQTAYEQYNSGAATYEQVTAASQKVSQLPESIIMIVGELAVKILGGIFANYIYKKKAVKEVRELRLNATSPEDYRIKLFKKGGISGVMCFLSCIGYYCAQQIVLILTLK